MMKLPLAFERYRTDIDAELRTVLAERDSPMYDMLRYHLGWIDEKGNAVQGAAGKAMRPILCLLVHETVAGDYRKALPAAAAIELVHNFSLIHDDIQDDDRERHHRPTVWSIWGKPQAINAGTAMRVMASLAMLRLAGHGAPAEKLLQAQRLLDESCLRLIEGQYLDISFESRLDVRVDDYLAMIERKTASLIACSTEMGALLGSEDQKIRHAFREYGRNLGLAFQIRDDLLGIWGDPVRTGKPVGSDIRRKKKSFPVVYGLEYTKREANAALKDIYCAEVIDDQGLSTALDVLHDVRAEAYTQQMVEQYRDLALAQLANINLSPWSRQNLEETADFVAGREY